MCLLDKAGVTQHSCARGRSRRGSSSGLRCCAGSVRAGASRVSIKPPTGGEIMTGVWALAALWLGLALVASLLSILFRISTALSEIVVGTIAQLIIGAAIGSALLGTNESWVQFLSGIGAIVLTFRAGAELDPVVFRLKWKEAAAIGLASFFFPFLGCAAAAHYLLRMGGHAELARRRRHVDHLGGGRLCRHAGIRLQRHGVRQDGARRLLRHRSGDRGGASVSSLRRSR